MRKILYILISLCTFYGYKAQVTTYTTQPASEGIDATIKSINATTNYGGTGRLQFMRDLSGNLERALLKFDLSSIPNGANIISAKLYLYGISHTTNSGGGILHLIPENWTENTVTWNNSTLLLSSSMPTIAIPTATSSTQNYTLTVTNMVQKMVNTPLINFGWLMRVDNEDASGRVNNVYNFGSSDTTSAFRPMLFVEYSNPVAISAYVTPATDASSTNGGIYLSVTQGVAPYTYLWSNSATTKDIYNIAKGVYTVTITDNNGFSTSKIIPVCSESVSTTFTIEAAGSTVEDGLLLDESFNDNTANTNYKDYEYLKAYNTSGGSGTTLARSLLAFDLNALPSNAMVNSANLILRDNESTHSTAFKVQLCRATQSWKEPTATYNNKPTYDTDTSDIVQFDYDGSLTDYTLNVTSQMQKMVTQVNSSYGWMLKLKTEDVSSLGQSVTFLGSDQSLGPKPKLVLQVTLPYLGDTDRNWKMEETYDENGNVISTTKTYLDALGRTTQNLGKNANNEVFTAQTIYDSYGRAAIQTMPAFTGNQLIYQTGFMRNVNAQSYSYTDFDTQSTLNNPGSIENNITNTLGYYYSNNNSYDAYQATASNPYSRIEYAAEPSGIAKRVSKPGNSFKMGSGKESYTFSMPSGDELKYVFGTNLSYKCKRDSSDYMNSIALSTTESIVAKKEIVITPDNREMISYTIGGKQIASCLSALSSSESCSYSDIYNTLSYKGTQSTDIHLPDVNKGSLYLIFPTQSTAPTTTTSFSSLTFTITDLYRDVILVSGTDYTLNTGTGQIQFNTVFSNLYTGRSYFLRISCGYVASYENSLLSSSVTPSDIKVKYGLNYGHFTKNYYDIGGSLRKSVSAKGFACTTPTTITMSTTFDYSHYGQLIAKKSPDEGLVEMTYDKQGRLRFSQNADQKNGNRFSYVNYDKHGRVYEKGEYQSSNASGKAWFDNYYLVGPPSSSLGITTSSIIDNEDGLLNSGKTNTTITGYAIPTGGSNDVPNTWSYYSSYQNFKNGLINYIKNANSIVWYNYDKVGRTKATITQITEPDFVAKTSTIDEQIKTSESTINYFNGLPQSNTFQNNTSTEYIQYGFNYDVNLRPTITTLAFGSIGQQNLSSNTYNKIGQLSRVVIGADYQGVDYVYTLDGALKAINHPGLDYSLDPGGDNGDYTGSGQVNRDLFGEMLEYHYNDYERTGTNIISASQPDNSLYNGLIYATRFKTRNDVNGTITGADYIDYAGSSQTQLINSTNYEQKELGFQYSYDEFNQFAKSTFCTYNNNTNVFTTRSEYAETGASNGNVTYDRNGNITRLIRQAFASVVLDNLTYTISSNSNMLTNILDAASNSYPSSFNFKTPSTSNPSPFGYNSIGQLTVSAAEGIDLIEYYPDGKIKKITYSNNNYTTYKYACTGEKLASRYYNSSANKYKYTWYVGPLVYEFDEAGANSFVIAEAKIPGGVIRTNSADISNGYPVYHLTDHLGNVRVTFKGSVPDGSNNGLVVLSYNDYYAFGGQLPGRVWAAENSRYGYQSQEKTSDGSNPWCQFELRQYNQDLGRWFAPDPFGQFASPYIAMANNPVSGTDPDGGWVNFAPPDGQKRFRGEAQKQWDIEHAQGAYAPDQVQKRYNDEFENLKTHYFGSEWGRRSDITGFLESVRVLNDHYAGLVKAFGNGFDIAYQSGVDYLSMAECGRWGYEVYQNNMQVRAFHGEKFNMKMAMYAEQGNELEKFAIDKRESTATHIPSMMNTAMGNAFKHVSSAALASEALMQLEEQNESFSGLALLNAMEQLDRINYKQLEQGSLASANGLPNSVPFLDTYIHINSYMTEGAAFTIPGFGIIAHPDFIFNDNGSLNLTGLFHEYGHILQAEEWGYDFYFEIAGPMSANDFQFGTGDHDYYWTEWTASRMAYTFAGQPSWFYKPISPRGQNIPVGNSQFEKNLYDMIYNYIKNKL